MDTHDREYFDTGLKKIRFEIKSRLVPHGLFGIVTDVDGALTSGIPDGSRIEIVVKGRSAHRTFDREQIEGCRLRVHGPVLTGIIAMIDELSAPAPQVS
jgi:hypothetical protein